MEHHWAIVVLPNLTENGGVVRVQVISFSRIIAKHEFDANLRLLIPNLKFPKLTVIASTKGFHLVEVGTSPPSHVVGEKLF